MLISLQQETGEAPSSIEAEKPDLFGFYVGLTAY
jgi:hypothetical protein